MKKTLLISLMLVLALLHQAVAQNRNISGRVTDRTTGEGIPGATILVVGTSIGISTNSDGTFALSVPTSGTTLKISSVGYLSVDRSLDKDVINVALAPDTKVIGEVVVTGYGGSQDIKDITGSYAQIDQSKLTSQPVQSADQALAGRIAGVQITNTSGTLGDAVTVRIRGINSISNSSQPLFVIDGVPMTEFGNFNVLTAGLRYNPLADINPNDIESMTVLKDASAAAIYGSRAANGVILITTKRGKSGQAKLSLNVSSGFMQAARLPDLLNAAEFTQITNEKYTNRFPTGTQLPIRPGIDFDGDGVVDQQNVDTDWLGEVFRKGFMQDYQAALSGGSDKGTYYGSLGYSDLQGSIVGNRLRRGNARINIDVTPKTWVKGGISTNFSQAFNEGVLTDRYLAGATVAAYNAPPTIPAYDPSGNYYLDAAGDLGAGQNQYGTYVINRFFHPVANIKLQRNNNTQRRLLGNAYMTILPIKSLALTTKFGIDYINNDEDQYSDPLISGLGRSFNGLVQLFRSDNTLTTWQNYATFNEQFGENHNVELTAGFEQNQEDYVSVYTPASDFVDPKFKYILDGLFVGELTGGGSRDVTGWQSYFGRANYSFGNKYYASFTSRYDGSSRFGTENRYGFFPGASVGWRISEEGFMDRFEFINDLKLRASYGLVGNSSGIGSYASRTRIGEGRYADFAGLGINQLGNPSLGWETSKKLDIGFDMSIVKDRVSIVFDYFNNNINNLLLRAPAVLSTGIPGGALSRNIGRMSNQGVEATINTTNLELSNGFRWTSSFNASYLRNEVKELADNNDIIPNNVQRVSVGRPLTSYRMIQWAGVNPDNGNPMFYTVNGDIKQYNAPTGTWLTRAGEPTTAVSAQTDGVYLDKQAFPKWFGGLDNTFAYKGLQLELFLQYSGGNYIYNSTRASMLTNGISNNIAEIKERWQNPGDQTDVPRLYIGDNTSNTASTRFLERGDFLRVRQIRLAYTLPSEMGSKFGMSRTSVFAMVQNAFVFTKYSGNDPEVNSNANEGAASNQAFGIDNRTSPQVRTITAGLNLDF